MKLGGWMKRVRLRRGLTQEQAAFQCALHVNKYRSYEKGARVTGTHFLRIIDGLQLPQQVIDLGWLEIAAQNMDKEARTRVRVLLIEKEEP